MQGGVGCGILMKGHHSLSEYFMWTLSLLCGYGLRRRRSGLLVSVNLTHLSQAYNDLCLFYTLVFFVHLLRACVYQEFQSLLSHGFTSCGSM
jgi:hypothetical protein